ncbi:hypothetical protein [Streptomyces cahuitamycinicus]|uniref:hypothetical protein n=1 Tax=Streptomyces cahuitamycinicus TaxID=2070367 RepID=UPI001FE3CBC9|nr:hypothetical protein [Streptomyces cahuitamycinicus]
MPGAHFAKGGVDSHLLGLRPEGFRHVRDQVVVQGLAFARLRAAAGDGAFDPELFENKGNYRR